MKSGEKDKRENREVVGRPPPAFASFLGPRQQCLILGTGVRDHSLPRRSAVLPETSALAGEYGIWTAITLVSTLPAPVHGDRRTPLLLAAATIKKWSERSSKPKLCREPTRRSGGAACANPAYRISKQTSGNSPHGLSGWRFIVEAQRRLSSPAISEMKGNRGG